MQCKDFWPNLNARNVGQTLGVKQYNNSNLGLYFCEREYVQIRWRNGQIYLWFEDLFARVEKIGDYTKLPEAHKALLLLGRVSSNYVLETTVAALCTKDTDQLSWEVVSADLIQELSKLLSKGLNQGSNNYSNRENCCQHNGSLNRIRQTFRSNSSYISQCTYRECKGHDSENYINIHDFSVYRLLHKNISANVTVNSKSPAVLDSRLTAIKLTKKG